MICFVFVGCEDPDLNILPTPRCIEQAESKSTNKGTKNITKYFFILCLLATDAMLYQVD